MPPVKGSKVVLTMKVDSNSYTTRMLNENESGKLKQNEKRKLKRESIQAVDLNLSSDDVTHKKIKARKKAMGLKLNQFKNDGKMDNTLDKYVNKLADAIKRRNDAKNALIEIEEKMLQLKEDYKIDDDSQEQKDLELMIKYDKSLIKGSGVILTPKEQKRMDDMGEMTEYQERARFVAARDTPFIDELKQSSKDMYQAGFWVKGIKQELLKYNGMVDMQKSADKIIEASNKEVVAMLLGEGKDYIEGEQKELIEKVEEKKKEEEKLLEMREKHELEKEILKGKAKINVENIISQWQIEASVQATLLKMKILENDIKGITVDEGK